MVKTVDDKEIKNNYVQNWFTLSSEYKNFYFQYSFRFPSYILSGAFLNTNENASHFFARYKYKDWSFNTGMYWIGMPSVSSASMPSSK